MVLGANWRLANAKSSMVHESNPDAECMDEIERTERKRNAQATSHRQSCFVTRCVFFVGRADFDFFLRLENTASFINARRHAGSSQLCLLALSRSDRRSLALLCCAVLAEQRKQQNSGKFPANILVGNFRLRMAMRREKISTIPSEAGEI